MSTNLSRRRWLKFSALSAGAALAFTSLDFSSETRARNNSNNFIKLTSNENPYGYSPKAREAMLDALAEGNRYAAPEIVSRLEREIADREGLKPESVVLGTGSGEILCMTAIAFGQKEIVAPDPTFPGLMRYAENLGARVKNVPLNEKFEHDLAAMARAVSENTSLVYVCNPNNPTAGVTPNEALHDFCRETAKRVPVFADEAYLEYTDEFPRNSMVELVRKGENVIVSRTFSKIYGMAGLRVGYGLANPELAQKLKKFRMTWLNNLSINAALAAYNDTDFIVQSRRRNAEVRSAVLSELKRMNLKYAPSEANFIWLNVGAELSNLGEQMRRRNILVGNPQNNWARITVGTADEMKAFVAALKEIKK
jgi:Histidinol-phosphate/aromatic aminotransferase and cobyric acid decarboxylase